MKKFDEIFPAVGEVISGLLVGLVVIYDLRNDILLYPLLDLVANLMIFTF